MISRIKGANYIIIKESKDINKYLVEDFKYLSFQDTSDLSLEITTPYIKIERIVSSGKEGVEKVVKKGECNLDNHKYYLNNFLKKDIFPFIIF